MNSFTPKVSTPTTQDKLVTLMMIKIIIETSVDALRNLLLNKFVYSPPSDFEIYAYTNSQTLKEINA